MAQHTGFSALSSVIPVFDPAAEAREKARAQAPARPAASAAATPVSAPLDAEAEALAAAAREAARGAEWARAADLWRDAIRAVPGHADFVPGFVQALQKLGRLDEVDAVLADATTRFPDNVALAVSRAANAAARGDWEQAFHCWSLIRSRFPGRVDTERGVVTALRFLGRLKEAEVEATRAAERFPEDGALAAERALVSEQGGAWGEALERWRSVQSRFPDRIDAWRGAARALRGLRRFDEAEAEAQQGWKASPNLPALEAELAAIASDRGDWQEAERRWTAFREHYPERLDGCRGVVRLWSAQRRWADAERALEAALAHFPDHLTLGIDQANLAAEAGDPELALRRWQALLARAPGHLPVRRGHVAALQALRRMDEAEQAAAAALDRFPNDLVLLRHLAQIAADRSSWEEALRRWSILRDRHPDRPDGARGVLGALRGLRRLPEAEAEAEAARARFPHDYDLLLEHALVAQMRADWPALLARADDLATRFPGRPAAENLTALALRGLRRYDEAETRLAAALTRFPTNPELLFTHARVAEAQKQYDEACNRWEKAKAVVPGKADPWAGLVGALRAQGRPDEAASLLDEAERRFPGHVAMELQRAWLANTGLDYEDAVARWQALKTRFPNNGEVETGLGEALMRANLNAVDRAAGGAAPAAASQREENLDALHDLFMQFESMGDNCEFGLVQRRFNAEPLGLLRWSSITVDELVRALDEEFAGVGDEENTILIANGEYITRDRNYRMTMHTFIREHEAEYDKLYVTLCKRLKFLRRTFLENLETNEKIFTYKSHTGMTLEQVDRIGAAVRRYGPNRVLCVTLADAENAPGTVRLRSPGVAVGYVKKFHTGDGPWVLDADNWRLVCERAHPLLTEDAA